MDSIAIAPRELDILGNTKETAMFFKKIANENRRKIKMDLQNTTNIPTETRMYIGNLKYQTERGQALGEVAYIPPSNATLSNRLETCRFLNGEDMSFELPSSEDEPSLKFGQCGYECDEEAITKACGIAQNFLNPSNPKYLSELLRKIIFSLMANTKEHAKGTNDERDVAWSLYVKVDPDKECVRFVFLDSGVGIPENIRGLKKSYIDINPKSYILKELMEIVTRDEIFRFLEIDLKEDFEHIFTVIGQDYIRHDESGRGEGLKTLDRLYREKRISSLRIISGNGDCDFEQAENPGNKISDNKSGSFGGTLFYWEIYKDGVLNE